MGARVLFSVILDIEKHNFTTMDTFDDELAGEVRTAKASNMFQLEWVTMMVKLYNDEMLPMVQALYKNLFGEDFTPTYTDN